MSGKASVGLAGGVAIRWAASLACLAGLACLGLACNGKTAASGKKEDKAKPYVNAEPAKPDTKRMAGPDAMPTGNLYGERWPGGPESPLGAPPEAKDPPREDTGERATKDELKEAADLVKVGKTKEADEKLDALRAKYPSDGEVYYQLGVMRARANKLKDAEKFLETATRLSPNSAKGFCDLALVYRQEGRFDDAVTAARTACRLDISNGRSFDILGLVYMAQENYAEAATAFGQAVSRNPNSALYLHHLGRALIGTKDYARAKKSLEESIRVRPTADAHNDRGRLLEALADPNGAKAAYQEALKVDANSALACYNLARILSNPGDLERMDPKLALTFAVRAVGLTEGKNAQYLTLLARVQRENGKLDEAIETQRAAVKVEPGPETQRALQNLLDEKNTGIPLLQKR